MAGSGSSSKKSKKKGSSSSSGSPGSHAETQASGHRSGTPAIKRVGGKYVANLFAHLVRDRTGAVAEVLALAGRFNVTVESASMAVHSSRFSASVNIAGWREHVEMNVQSNQNHSLFSGPVPRVRILDSDPPSSGMKRRHIAVTSSDVSQVQEVADLAAAAGISIAFFELKWVDAPHGNRVVVSRFSVDVHRLSMHIFNGFIDDIGGKRDQGQLDLIRFWPSVE